MLYQPECFCFIHVPRCGGQAVRAAVLGQSVYFGALFCNQNASAHQVRPHTRRHTTWRELAAIVPDLPRIYSFCTIRNPFDFFESNYSQAVAWRDGILRTKPRGPWIHQLRDVQELLRGGFRDFVQRHEYIGGSGGILKHWAGDITGRVSVSEVIPLEQLTATWPTIWPRLQPQIPYFNTPPDRRPPLPPAANAVPRQPVEWDRGLVQLVRRWCRYDFEHYYPDAKDPI